MEMTTVGPRLISLLGLLVMLLLAWLLSESRRQMNWRLIGTGVLCQFLFALVILKTAVGRAVFSAAQAFVNGILDCGRQGSTFVFGAGYEEHFFAFSVLGLIIFFASLTAVLFHWGIIQIFIKALAWSMVRLMDASGAESLSAAANIFVGHTEAPLVIRPFLKTMTRSEITAMLTGGMATISGSVMAAYIGLGIDAGHLLAASIMSAPASLVIAKIMVPEREESPTKGHVSVQVPRKGLNTVDAACHGASDGLKLALNVGAMVLAFVSLVALINWGLEWGQYGAVALVRGKAIAGEIQATAPLTFERILGWLFCPFAWLMGIPGRDATLVGQILGEKTVLNEFVAYMDLIKLREQLDPRSFTIATYAVCGFANFGSIAIQIGGIGSLVPSRRGDIAKLSFRSMLGGTLAAFMTACVVGLLI